MPHTTVYVIAFFLPNIVLRLLNILSADNYRCLQLDVKQIELKNVKTMQIKPTIMILRHSKLHMP